MNENIAKVKELVRAKASNPEFIHYKWFAKWHLEVVESIAEGFLKHYLDADKDVVRVMVWMRDYGKIIDFDSQYAHEHVDNGRAELVGLGFSEEFAGRVAEGIKILDAKVDLDKAPIEVQIVSSADGCSHITGPFLGLYWWENPQKSHEEIMAGNLRKITGDWDKKVVLPEARRAFQHHYDVSREQSGELSESF